MCRCRSCPEVLRAKVRVFTDLYRKNRQLERLNAELEQRVSERTAELEASTMRLLESEQRRSLALAAGNMGSWDWDLISGRIMWDAGQHAIYGVIPGQFAITPEHYKVLIVPEDWDRLQTGMQSLLQHGHPHQAEFRVRRPNGEVRWCASTAAASTDGSGKVVRISGVTMDITERKEAEERQALLAREVDHRAKNAMAIVQSIVRLTKATNITNYASIIEGRIKALSRAHALLSNSRWQGADLSKLVDEELAPYRSAHVDRLDISGPKVLLEPTKAQTLALALHELATNAVKYGALSSASGKLAVRWELDADALVIHWHETAGPETHKPAVTGFGTQIITGSIERQLGGETAFEWLPTGLRCSLTVPRGERLVPSELRSEVRPALMPARPIAACRVMIVEDEALVALVLADQLADMGVSVIGPCGSVAEARSAASGAMISTPRSSTSISVASWSIRSPTCCRRAASRSSSSPAMATRASTRGSRTRRCSRNRSSMPCSPKCSAAASRACRFAARRRRGSCPGWLAPPRRGRSPRYEPTSGAPG